MKYELAAALLLSALLGPSIAVAQQAGTEQDRTWQDLVEEMAKTVGTNDTIVFASVDRLSHGVRIDGANPLGEYSPVQGTTDVAFRECGSDESEVIPATSVLPTAETCGSMPGILRPSVQARHWIYNPSRNGFQVASAQGDAQPPTLVAFVSCQELPNALLVAAQKTREGDKTVAGPAEALADLGVKAGKGTEVTKNEVATPELCRNASEFWTLDASKKALSIDQAVHVLGISGQKPPYM